MKAIQKVCLNALVKPKVEAKVLVKVAEIKKLEDLVGKDLTKRVKYDPNNLSQKPPTIPKKTVSLSMTPVEQPGTPRLMATVTRPKPILPVKSDLEPTHRQKQTPFLNN